MTSSYEKVGAEDMILIDNLTEQSILENIHTRFVHDLIYTYTGSILVAVNPYQDLPIYTPEIASSYEATSDKETLPPHVFAIADLAYVRMREEGKNQSILISGESGSGKTESTKLILRYLATRNNRHSRVEQSLLEISPILESFGNAKTVRNDNSSRFGKFIEVCFGSEAEGLKGAKVVQYLLEKSRIVGQAEGERNYHIFYQMLAGMGSAERAALKLGPATSYAYLNTGGCCTINGVDDADDFRSVMAAFQYLSISKEEQQNVIKVLAAILHLGNLKFKKAANETIAFEDEDMLKFVASLLSVSAQQLTSALTQRKLNIRNAVTVTALQLHEVLDVRNALAKALFGNLFQWIVRTINSKIDPPSCECSIGILDIFGFENFKLNSFEQLCINYCNEKLQQHFNQHIFKLEQQEYLAEGINWSKVDFVDNQDTLTLIERKPLGVLAIVDEECRFPQASDSTMLVKLHQNCADSSRYEKPRVAKNSFGITHYAGSVKYEVENFLAKNRDTLSMDLMELLSGSANAFIVDLFNDKYLPVMPETTIRRGTKSYTVAFQFKEQLNELMTALAGTTPSFIRCIKPNSEKAGSQFDKELVLTQLRYSGMLETVRIRKAGYGMRFPFAEFFQRYKVLHPTLIHQKDQPENLCNALCKHLVETKKLQEGEWITGKTKVFLRDKQHTRLEDFRVEQFQKKSVIIQKMWRMYAVRDFYRLFKESTIAIQTTWRKYTLQNRYNAQRRASLSIQIYYRAKQQRLKYYKLLLTVLAGAAARGYLARKSFRTLVTAKRKRDEENKQRLEKERKQREKEEQKRLEEDAKKRKEEEERLKKLQEKEKKTKLKEEEQRKKEEIQAKLKQSKESQNMPTSPRKEAENPDTLKQAEAQAQAQANEQRKKEEEDAIDLKKRELESLQRASSDMLHRKQEEAAILAASKRIVQRSSGNYAASDPGAGSTESTPISTPERTRRSFVLSASGNRRSRSKTSPMIAPIEDLEAFKRDNPDLEGELEGPTNNSIDVPSLMFRKQSMPEERVSSINPNNSQHMTAKPAALAAGVERQSLAQAEIGSLYSKLMEKKKPSFPTLTRRGVPSLPQSPIYLTCSQSRVGGNFLSANVVTPHSSKTKIPPVLQERDRPLMEVYISGNISSKYQKDLSFSTKPLKCPLLKAVTGEASKLAMQTYDIILTYMNDKKGKGVTSTIQHWTNVQELLRIGMTNKSLLRSEIYLQIYKQITQNTNLLHALSGWELMAFCSSTFPPEESLHKPLVGLLLDIAYESAKKPHEAQFAEWALLALDYLRKSILFGDRKLLPSFQELEAIKTQTIISIPVFFMDSSEKQININSFTTSQDVCDEILLMVGIDTMHLKEYTLYEVSGENERSMWPDERICDIISKWEIYKKSVAGTGVNVSFAFLFKQQIFLMDEKVEIADVSILGYHQGVASVISDNYLISSEDVVLALSALQITYDAMTPMTACVPKSLFHRHSADDWEILVNKKSAVMGLRNITPNKARSLYNSYLRELPFYGCTVFSVKDPSKQPVILAVNVYGLHIVDAVTKDIRQSFPLTQFEQWEYTSTTLSLSFYSQFLSDEIPPKYVFSTVQGVEVVHLLEKYSHIMKAFPFPYVLLVPHREFSSSPIETIHIGEVLRVIGREHDTLTVTGQEKSSVRLPLAVCLPSIDPALSLAQAGNYVEVSISNFCDAFFFFDFNVSSTPTLAMSASTAKAQEEDLGHYLALVGTLPTVDPRTFHFSDFVWNNFRKTAKHKEKRGVFSKDSIDISLLDLPDPTSKKAVKIFSSILKYCGLKTTSTFDARSLIQNMTQAMLDTPELRDEVYCQLMKQTTLNPKRYANKKAWELIAVAIGCVAPTERLLDFLVVYLQENVKLETDYSQLVKVAQARLADTLNNSVRTLSPTYYEINCVLNCAPLYCEVSTADNVIHKIPITSNTSMRDMIVKVAEKLKITPILLKGYYMYARVPDSSSLFQNRYTKLGTFSSLKFDLAVPDIWRVLEHYYTGIQDKKQKKDSAAALPTLLMPPLKLRRKIMLSGDVPENHVLANLEACQGAQDIFMGKYPATALEATNFAALYLQFTHGDYMATSQVVDAKNIRTFIAPHIFNASQLTADQWAEALNIAYASLTGISAQDARVQFLRNLRNWTFYGSTLFLVRLRDSSTQEPANSDNDAPADNSDDYYFEAINPANTGVDSVWLAIHKSGIEVLSYPEFNVVRSIPIKQVAGWGFDGNFFNITVGSLRKPVKVFFYSPEAPEIDTTIREYIDILANQLGVTGKSPGPVRSRAAGRIAVPTGATNANRTDRSSRILPTTGTSEGSSSEPTQPPISTKPPSPTITPTPNSPSMNDHFRPRMARKSSRLVFKFDP